MLPTQDQSVSDIAARNSDGRSDIADAANRPVVTWLQYTAAENITLFSQALSPRQQQRLNDITSPRRKLEYAAGRWLIKQSTGHNSEDQDNGLPYIITLPNIKLSLTHTHLNSQTVVALIASSHACGIDAEFATRNRSSTAIEDRYFDNSERKWLDKQGDKKKAFLQLWTAKEATIKAQKKTLGQALSTTIVELKSRPWLCRGMTIQHQYLECEKGQCVLAIASDYLGEIPSANETTAFRD